MSILKRRVVKTLEQDFYRLVYWIPRAGTRKYPKPSSLKQQKFILSYSGVQKSEVKAMFSFDGSRENTSLALLASGVCWQSVAFLGL